MHSTIHKRRIILRADGNSRIGLGHVVRSLALASMLRDYFECVFAIQEPDDALKAQILETCDGIISLPLCAPTEERFNYELAAYISEEEIVVLDGYSFATAYQQTIKARGAQLVCIDDIHAYSFAADVVLNQAGGIEAANYRTAPYTKLLLGPEFALLRPPFLEAARQHRTIPTGELHILLNLGGADPENYTLRLAQEIATLHKTATIEIVAGSAYKHLDELQSWVEDSTNYSLHHNLDAEQMCKLMQKCAVAVTSASGVAYEYAAVGGMLFVLQTADNQTGLYKFLTKNGVAQPYSLEAVNSDSFNQFEKQLSAQRRFFDGQSDKRLLAVFEQLNLSQRLTLRQATIADLELIFDWNNDPEVRRQSFNPEPILLDNHTRWYTARLEDTACRFYIAEIDGLPAAQIRFDIKEGIATISYLISIGYRGKGLGHIVLQKGIAKLKAESPDLKLVEGLVQQNNRASVRAFEKAGFNYGTPAPEHPDAYHFVLELP
ncbi:UDP-2,4-diacetamido-2,4,6-trideoxy-beta-L-altropyranose hydrolase [Pontibacter burrus]|uniref:UDP-2,4-diacetamido-2,4, 6-trideoxy-beta-L-altropyranose hydrolase n=1 Tax=Pontibacter burrus TaxID=2704466 RepID=UPI001F24DD8F|nr:UDP-2,4-diacetamido-2,4,6-trideoxy-beta-L-altropyranose hydrolase [Pontibacter burrus]